MRVKQVYAFVVRDIKVFASDKVALFWMVAWPLIWLLLAAYIFVPPADSRPPIRLAVGVVNLDTRVEGLEQFSIRLVEVLSNATYGGSRIFDVRLYDVEGQLVEDLRLGKLHLGIVIPANFSIDLAYGTAKLKVLVGAGDLYTASVSHGVISGFLNRFSLRVGLAKANISLAYFEELIEHLNQTLLPANTSLQELTETVKRYVYGIAAPLDIEYEEVKPRALATRASLLGWTTIGAVGMMFLYSGFSYGASAIYRERAYGTLKRIVSSPMAPSTLVLALMLSNMVVLLASAIVIILAGVYLVGASITFSPLNPLHWLAALLMLAAAYMSLGIGLALSLLAKTMQGASSLGTALGLLIAFTTGIWLPVQMLPSWLQELAKCSPITWAVDTVRNIMVYERGLEEVWVDVVKVALALALIVGLDVVVYKARLRKTITGC